MKTVNLIIGIMLLSITTIFAQQAKTETITAKGNCGMCESRIEKAATSVKGVSSAEWDAKTDKLVVTYDATKTDIHKVEMAIAKVGHDTDSHKADDKVYNALPGCCKYR